MPRIVSDVEEFVASRPQLGQVVKAFLHDFDVTWGARKQIFGSDLDILLLRPEPILQARFGLEREVMLLYSRYRTIEPRALQAATSLLSQPPASGRAEPLVFFLVSSDPQVRDSVRKLVSDTSFTRIPVPLTDQECVVARGEGPVRRALESALFARDLFDIQQPIREDVTDRRSTP